MSEQQLYIQLKDYMQSKGYHFEGHVDHCLLYFHKDIEGIDFVFCLCLPHEDTNNRYVLRANARTSFTKWGEVDFEAYFADTEDFLMHSNEWLCSSRW